MTHKEFMRQFNNINSNLTVLDIFVDNTVELDVACKTCKKEFKLMPLAILGGGGCPTCTPKEYYANSDTFANVFPSLLKYFKNPEECKNNSVQSTKTTTLICPICKKEQQLSFAYIAQNGFKCTGCENLTYPNKMLRSVVNALPDITAIKYEKTFVTKRGAIRYDAYFKYHNQEFVIEMNGEQHYRDCGYNNYDVNTQIIQDQFKEQYAVEHGMIFIAIDCRESKFGFIQTNLLNSKLSNYFDMQSLDWKKIFLNFNDFNLLSAVCNDYETLQLNQAQLGDKYHLDRHHIATLLQTGLKLGLCPSYTLRKKQVFHLVNVFDENHNYINTYTTASAAAQTLNKLFPEKNFSSNLISHVLNGAQKSHRGFYFERVEE